MKGIRVVNALHHYTRYWLRRTWVLFSILIILAAILMTFLRAMTPWINQHKQDVEQQLSTLLGETVSIKTMETGWSWFQPMLKLDEVLVSQNGVPVLQLNKLLVGVNLWSSLLHWQIQPGILLIDDVQLTLRETPTGWHVDGIRQGDQLPTMNPKSYLPVLHWLLLQQKIKIKNVSAMIYLKDGTLIPIDSLTIQAAHRRGRYFIKGKVRVGGTYKTELTMQGNISFLSNLFETIEGELFFSAENFQFLPLKSLLTHLPYSIEQGEGNAKAWLKFQSGHIIQAQSTRKILYSRKFRCGLPR